MPDPKVTPFLRWAGGKRQLVSTLLERVPGQINGRYCEPFLGAGSLFFALAPINAFLSDANRYLIDTYRQISLNPEAVRRALRNYVGLHSKAHYYRTRTLFNITSNESRVSAAQAARFIYLNKACFNGIFRVNTRGEFNVPKGSKKKLHVPTKSGFERIAERLRQAELEALDYSEALARVGADDFVYLDPPYPALNGTAYFAHYTADRFSDKAQENLAECVIRMNNLGTRFLMSNADTDLIRTLYRGFEIEAIPVTRYVSCKGTRAAAAELLIKNY